MLFKRIVTAAWLLPLFVSALLYLPNRYWAVLVLAISLIAAWEWCALAGFGRAGRWFFAITMLALCLSSLLAARSITEMGLGVQYAMYWIAAAFWVLVVPAWLRGWWRVRHPALLGAAGCAVLVPSWFAIVELQRAPYELLMLMGIVWIADVAAFFAGRVFGRRKLAPSISPGKTWEGVGGAAGAVALYYVLLQFSPGTEGAAFLQPAGVVLFAVVTAAGIEGDLFESWIKRRAGAKDSGSLLPGHGGVLDRIDALTSSMPLAALMLLYLR